MPPVTLGQAMFIGRPSCCAFEAEPTDRIEIDVSGHFRLWEDDIPMGNFDNSTLMSADI